MRLDPTTPPRTFIVGLDRSITIRDCGRLRLEPDEQVTLTTPAGAEYDVARKAWGFYATPSTNGRLRHFGLRTALVLNRESRLYVMLVEADSEAAFARYCAEEELEVLAWLDDDDSVARLATACREASSEKA